jgi:4-hydroxy-3-polyprenylbenzoate decarboxylase
MLTLARMGTVILPPMPAFYTHPTSVDDIIDHTVSRILDQFGIDVPGTNRWSGTMQVGHASAGD